MSTWRATSLWRWLKWFCWDTRRCRHEPGPWLMRDGGMGKAKYCTRCGKCLETI